MPLDMLISEAHDERRLWHKVTSIGPIPKAGKHSEARRFHLLCSYRQLSWHSSPSLLVADGSGFIDERRSSRVVIAGEPLDAQGQARAHSPIKARVRLCHICFAAGTAK